MLPRPVVTSRKLQHLLAAFVAVLCPLAGPLRADESAADFPQVTVAFLENHCYDCHQGDEAEAGLDLSSLSRNLSDRNAEHLWVRVHDRVRDGEMPPAEMGVPEAHEVEAFVDSTAVWLREHQWARHAEHGRTVVRRLTRREIERSLHDLLGIDIPLANQLPEEARSSGFSTVADGQTMSHFQLQRHLAVVDTALDEAFRRAFSEDDPVARDLDAAGVARRNPKRRNRDPEMRNGQAVVWSSGLIYYGRISATTAPDDGWYRFTVTVSALKTPASGGVWSTVHTGLCVSSAPLLNYVTAFEATETPQTIEFEAWLPRRHMLEIRPGDITLKRARFAGGQVGVGEGDPQDVPGIAIDRLTMQRIYQGPANEEIRRLLLGELVIRSGESSGAEFQLLSDSPQEDLAQLMRAFARRAFRRPVPEAYISDYIALAQSALDSGKDLTEALRVGYRALLCSPRFLYLTEVPGKLDDHAIAARLSYFLTGSTPDRQLAGLADAGEVSDLRTVHSEIDRLLEGEREIRFVKDFAAEWLDLDQIDFTQPDRKLFPAFDATVKNSMLAETHTFLTAMLRENLSVTGLIEADFTFLNSRLARYYGIEGVEGGELQRVELHPQYHRGGVLTQGAILKVTANGSHTSPVVRGVWASERLLGVPIPPPPDNVPAIDPDIRGAKTIREQLAKHRSQDSCASCHVKIDPPGFALENFDPAGQWRDKYFRSGKRRSKGNTVDASYTLPDGRGFSNIDDFRSLVVAEPRRLAANVAEKLMVYGTGASVGFADREAIEQIVDETAKDNYGFRSIIHSVATNDVFLSK